MQTYNKVIILLFLIITLINITGCSKNHKNNTENTEIIRPVKFTKVQVAGNTEKRVFSGVTEAQNESILSFKVSGNIIGKYVEVGDYVHKGQLIARLDSEPYSIQTQGTMAELEQQKAKLINAYNTYIRTRNLYINDSAAKSDLDAAKADYEASIASIKAIKAKIRFSKLNERYTNLIAPANGSIASINAEINENVAAGQPVVKILSDSEMKVKISMPENLIYEIKRGAPVIIKFDAIEDKAYSGYISEIGSGATGQLTTYPVFVRLTESDSRIHSGMSANVTFNFPRSGKKVILVPVDAVTADATGKFVFLIGDIKNGLAKVSKKYVQVGEITSEGIEIISGLKAGDKIVTAGVARIQDNETVAIKDNL